MLHPYPCIHFHVYHRCLYVVWFQLCLVISLSVGSFIYGYVSFSLPTHISACAPNFPLHICFSSPLFCVVSVYQHVNCPIMLHKLACTLFIHTLLACMCSVHMLFSCAYLFFFVTAIVSRWCLLLLCVHCHSLSCMFTVIVSHLCLPLLYVYGHCVLLILTPPLCPLPLFLIYATSPVCPLS